jgi:5'(3')-deoxyribonucleotidase
LKIKRIFLDLDDVLNEFTMTTLQRLGCDIVDYDPAWGWDIVRAANASHPLRHYTPPTFWDSFDREHWATMPKSDMCDWLVDRCVALVGRDNVCVLTTPTKDPDCLAGKLEWIHANLPSFLHGQYLIGPQKHLCAKPDSLLIDDRDKNVSDFRKAGGQAVLVARPWNGCRTAHNSQPKLRFDLAKLFDVGY